MVGEPWHGRPREGEVRIEGLVPDYEATPSQGRTLQRTLCACVAQVRPSQPARIHPQGEEEARSGAESNPRVCRGPHALQRGLSVSTRIPQFATFGGARRVFGLQVCLGETRTPAPCPPFQVP